MLPIISWKNVWRNKTRSLVVIVAMLIGVFSGTFIIALSVGMIESRARSVVDNQTAHIQIHHPQYADYQEIQYIIENASQKADSIRNIPGVKAVNHKFKTMVMSNYYGNNGGMYVSSVDKEMDTSVFKIYEELEDDESSYFGTDDRRPIVISQKLAKSSKMELYVIDSASLEKLSHTMITESVLSILKKYEGEEFRNKKDFAKMLKSELDEKAFFEHRNVIYRICAKYNLKRKLILSIYGYDEVNRSQSFRVVGYYKTNDAMFDNMNAFILEEDFENFAKVPANTTHEFDIVLEDTKQLNQVKAQLEEMFPDLKVESYRDLKPDIAMMEAMMELYTFIIMGIILLALAFGIINTMLMAVLERTKEIGMLKAIGMNRKRVFFMIMYETVYLGLVGGIAGMGIGYLFVSWLEKKGLNLSMFQEGFEAMGYDAIMYPKLEPIFFIEVTLLVIIAGILSAIVPARRALKLNPAEAVRSDI